MQKFKAVVFDLDGTLAETGDMCITNVYETFSHYGLKPKLGGILETFGASEPGTFSRFVPDHAEEAFQKYLEITKKNHYLCSEPFEGIKDLLSYLQGKVPVGLITGKSREAAEITLSELGIREYFQKLICGEPLVFKKPEHMTQMCEYLNLKPEEVVYIGDFYTDVRSANKVGLFSVAALWSKDAVEKDMLAENPKLVVHTVEELTDFLKQHLTQEL